MKVLALLAAASILVTVTGYNITPCSPATQKCLNVTCGATTHLVPITRMSRMCWSDKHYYHEPSDDSIRRCIYGTLASCEKHCFPTNWKCDGIKDCFDGNDEQGCGSCQKNEVRCNNGVCVNPEKLCNGYNDCRDGSDEFGCRSRSRITCPYDRYSCGFTSGWFSCKAPDKVCDGHKDCYDGEDEQNCSK